MEEIQMGVVESRFANIIWENEPVTTSQLVKLAERALSWKRTTTHTVIKRLCEKGLFVNTNGVVTACVSRDEYYTLQSKRFVKNSFHGSLPAFIAAFTKGQTLSTEEIEEIQKMIDEARS